MTATRTRRPAAAKKAEPGDPGYAPDPAYPGPPLPVLELACDNGCGGRFTDPAAAGHADLRLRAYADGWVTDGGWTVCPACAHGWHLHEPSETVASITGILAGLDADKAREAIGQVILVHDDARLAGMWCCPRCEEVFDRYMPHSPCSDATQDPSGPGSADPPGAEGGEPDAAPAVPGPEASSFLSALAPEKERNLAAFLGAGDDSGAGGKEAPPAPDQDPPAADGQAPAAAGDQDSPGPDGHPAPSGPGEPDLDDPALDRADGGATS